MDPIKSWLQFIGASALTLASLYVIGFGSLWPKLPNLQHLHETGGGDFAMRCHSLALSAHYVDLAGYGLMGVQFVVWFVMFMRRLVPLAFDMRLVMFHASLGIGAGITVMILDGLIVTPFIEKWNMTFPHAACNAALSATETP